MVVSEKEVPILFVNLVRLYNKVDGRRYEARMRPNPARAALLDSLAAGAKLTRRARATSILILHDRAALHSSAPRANVQASAYTQPAAAGTMHAGARCSGLCTMASICIMLGAGRGGA